MLAKRRTSEPWTPGIALFIQARWCFVKRSFLGRRDSNGTECYISATIIAPTLTEFLAKESVMTTQSCVAGDYQTSMFVAFYKFNPFTINKSVELQHSFVHSSEVLFSQESLAKSGQIWSSMPRSTILTKYSETCL